MASIRTYEDTAVNRRINISLPEETLRLLDRVADKGDRSRFIQTPPNYVVAPIPSGR